MPEMPLQHVTCPVVVLKIGDAEVRGDARADSMPKLG